MSSNLYSCCAGARAILAQHNFYASADSISSTAFEPAVHAGSIQLTILFGNSPLFMAVLVSACQH